MITRVNEEKKVHFSFLFVRAAENVSRWEFCVIIIIVREIEERLSKREIMVPFRPLDR